MTRRVALALLLLAGCDQPSETTATDADAINAINMANSNAVAIEELQARLDELEASNEHHDSSIDTLFSNDNEIEGFINETEDRVATVETRLGM